MLLTALAAVNHHPGGTMLSRYGLSGHYEAMRSALRVGDLERVAAELSRVLGFEVPADVTPVDQHETATYLRYGGFKPAELAMLAADLKPVVKFEDIPQHDALRFVRRFEGHYRLLLSQPYFKDRLLLRTRRAGTADEGPLVTIYASRGEQGAELRAIEKSSIDEVEQCGRLLGFPPCCVTAFADTMHAARDDQDALNDDAIRRLLAATQGQPGYSLLDPLSDYEVLAFYPCSPTCEAAQTIAQRNLDALVQTAPAAAARARETLGRPVLFWRTPFFIVFDPQAKFQADGSLRYSRAKVHVFEDREVSKLQRVFAGAVLPLIHQGDRLEVREQVIRVRRGPDVIGELEGSPELPPLLGRWDQDRQSRMEK